jgi:hypothetical protein
MSNDSFSSRPDTHLLEILSSHDDNVLKNPIYCGYLLAFSRSQYCAENVSFVIAINKFKASLRADPTLWKGSSWKDLDTKYRITASDFDPPTDEPWPSSIITKEEVIRYMDKIWDTFLSDNAETQICLPSKVLNNTKRRVLLVHAYGPDIYDEVLLDPLKTIRRDIMPRFLASPIFLELEMRAENLKARPSASSLVVETPTSITISEEVSSGRRSADLFLVDFLQDRILYGIFLKYLQSIISSENLLCVMMINQFEQVVLSGQNLKVSDVAWSIYLYFIVADSAFEVSVSHRNRREIMYGLAQPYSGLFAAPEATSKAALQESFRNFKSTSAYTDIQSSIIQHLDAEKKGSSKSTPALCSWF